MTFDPFRTFPGYALRRASNATLSRLTSNLAELDLRVTEGTILVGILKNPKITQSELGRMFGIASANVAPLIGRLDARDLIKRIPVDGRSHGLTLTQTGMQLANNVLELMKEHERALLERIPPHLREEFIDVLNSLWDQDLS